MDLKYYTYKGWAFVAALQIMAVIITTFVIISIFLNLGFCLRSMHLKRKLTLKKNLQKSEENEEELQNINTIVKSENSEVKNRDGLDNSGYNTWSDEDAKLQNSHLNVYDKIGQKSNLSFAFKMVTFIFEIGSVICTFSLLDVCVTFGYIQPTKTFIILKLILWIIPVFILYHRQLKIVNCNNNVLNKYKENKRIIIFAEVGMIIFYCFSITTFGSGACLASHNELLDGMLIDEFGGLQLSTSFSRMLQPSTCPKSKIPCLTYLTLPEDSIREMFVNFHININSCVNQICTPMLKYKRYEDLHLTSKWENSKVIKSDYESLPSEYEQRNIFTAYLKELQENTKYAFMISLTEDSFEGDLYYFKTLDPNKLTIVNGGDIGINKCSVLMNSKGLKDTTADLILIGGDSSYDNNFSECYRADDLMLKQLPHFQIDPTTNHIKLIPMIISSGNHEYGVDSNHETTLTNSKYEPLFKHYFPQNSIDVLESKTNNKYRKRNRYSITQLEKRIVIISLDSGYELKVHGYQTKWLENVLEMHKDYPIKMVHYHEPLYPVCGYEIEDAVLLGRQYWVPLFEKYNVTVVFENHSHRLKRTFPLLKHAPHENGISYVGDGSWGALSEDPCEISDPNLFAFQSPVNHVWIVKIDKDIELAAIDKNGSNLDSFTIKIRQ